MSGRIFVFGSINLDLIASTTRLPKPGETVMGSNFTSAAGGKGANQALAAQRAKANVTMCGAVGADDFANQALELLQKDGVDLKHVNRTDGTTGVAIILVDAAGENVITIVPAANATLSANDANLMLKDMTENDILMCQQEVPHDAISAALKICRDRGATSLLNIAPIIDQTAELAQSSDIIIANETEFALMAGQKIELASMEQAAKNYVALSGKTLCITLGGDGAIWVSPQHYIRVDALPITPVDTVGAGDTFCGYLAAGLLDGASPDEAMKRAAAAGSLACLNKGAQPAIPFKAVVDKALAGAPGRI